MPKHYKLLDLPLGKVKLPSHGTRFCMRCFFGGVRKSIAPLRTNIAYVAARPQQHRTFIFYGCGCFKHVKKISARQKHAFVTE
jgi:hypothetical protein